MMGVLRTSSQPGQPNEKPPPLRTREGGVAGQPGAEGAVITRRRRSNTFCDSPGSSHQRFVGLYPLTSRNLERRVGGVISEGAVTQRD